MTTFEEFHGVPTQGGVPSPQGSEFHELQQTIPIPVDEIQNQLNTVNYPHAEAAPTRPASSVRDLLANRAFRWAATITAAAGLVGAVAAGVLKGGDRAVAGMPMAAASAPGKEAPVVPGQAPDGSASPERKETGVVNLCEKFSLEDIGEWAFGTSSVIPPQEGLAPEDRITCNGEVPTNTDVPMENFVATGEWEFPKEGMNSFPVDLVTIQVVKDELPDSSSYFEQQSRSYSESPQIETIGDVQVTMLSDSGTTLARVPQADGTIMDVRFSIKLPVGMGSESPLPYPSLHKGEVAAMPAILQDLDLAK